MRIAATMTCAFFLCSFSVQISPHELYQFRGKPISELVARLGEPIEKRVLDGNRIYYWSIFYTFGRNYTCKSWTIVDKQDIITNLGYESCAY